MKKMKLLLVVCLFGALVVSCSQMDDQFTNIQEESIELKNASMKNKYIVVLKEDALIAKLEFKNRNASVYGKAEGLLKKHQIADVPEEVYCTVLQGFTVQATPGQVKKMMQDEVVKYIQPDVVYTLRQPDVVITGKPVTPPPAQSVPWGINRVNGGTTYTGTNVAWIVDSGIDLDHPDLNVDVVRSKSFVTRETSPDDLNGHGTHVAGTVAAINNSIGVVGVAAGATVISCRVLDRKGTGSFSWTIAALDYIVANGVPGDVVNMSLGPTSRYTDQAVDDAVLATGNAGILVAMAAGNASDDALYYSPARTNGVNIYTVSAMDSNNVFASFSNFGTPVDYCEPGVNVYSCYKGGVYATMSGTSMASPHLAGLLLLGSIATDGYVAGDPDNSPDPIGVH